MTSGALLENGDRKSQPVSNTAHSGLLLQRKCSCGGATSSLTGECEACKKKRLQKTLSIGASNDPLEHEADRVADQVISMSPKYGVSNSPLRIQRATGRVAADAGIAPPSVDRVLASPGRPLNPALQKEMGQRFGHDFSRVRVHTGHAAEQSARDINGNAYTVGQNIVFGAGRFAPESRAGQRLLAHELTHVVQQAGAIGDSVVRRQDGAGTHGHGHHSHRPAARHIDVNLETQTARAFEGARVVRRFRLRSGRPTHPTHTGHYSIGQRDLHHRSSLYGKCIPNSGGHGREVKHGRNSCRHGEHYQGAAMPYFLRFHGAEGFHQGPLGEASHGCLHLTHADASWLFGWARKGTGVDVHGHASSHGHHGHPHGHHGHPHGHHGQEGWV